MVCPKRGNTLGDVDVPTNSEAKVEPNEVNESKTSFAATYAEGQLPTSSPEEKKDEGNKECEPLDLSCYYQKYQHDRVKAIMALRIDTGMGAVDAKNTIDALFDSQITNSCGERGDVATSDVEVDCNDSGLTRCPQCMSSKLFIHKTNVHRPLIYYRTPVWGLIGSIIHLCNVFLSRRKEFVCLDCGYIWKK